MLYLVGKCKEMDKNKSLISVIVPIYNIEDYLHRCIESLIVQSYENVEIILVDDGSTDSCGEICDKFAQIDDRIKVIHKENGGLVSARKSGVRIASGEYITHVDGDDWIDSDRIERLVTIGLKDSPDLVYMNGFVKEYSDRAVKTEIKHEEQEIIGQSDIRNQIIPRLLRTDCCFTMEIFSAVWTWAVKSDIAKCNQARVPDYINRSEDTMVTLFNILSAKSLSIIDCDGYHYVQRHDSMMGRRITLDRRWYRETKEAIKSFAKTDCLIDRYINFATVNAIIISDYQALLNNSAFFLYPFSQIVVGCSVAIYGAGLLGGELVKYIQSDGMYKLVGVVDKSQNLIGKQKSGVTISNPEKLLEWDYDFVAIAINNGEIAKGARDNLVKMGVDINKIALMDPNVITEEYIPKKYRI